MCRYKNVYGIFKYCDYSSGRLPFERYNNTRKTIMEYINFYLFILFFKTKETTNGLLN